MSQHLITDFINRTYVFKPFYGGQILNHTIKKTKGTNRKNYISAQVLLKNTHASHEKTQIEHQSKKNEEKEQDHVDITV